MKLNRYNNTILRINMSAVPTTALDLYIEYSESNSLKNKSFKVPDSLSVLQILKNEIILKILSVYNNDNVSHIFTLSLNDYYHPIDQILGSFTLNPGESLYYSDQYGFQLYNSAGGIITTQSAYNSIRLVAVAGTTITLPVSFPGNADIPLIFIDGVPNSKNYNRVGSLITFTDGTTFAGAEELLIFYKEI